MDGPNIVNVSIYENLRSQEDFEQIVQQKRKPAILRGIFIGDCCEKWSVDYLVQNIGHLQAKIHVSSESKMDFINKNFLYKTLSMGETIKRASTTNHKEYFIHSEELYYLRSLSNERRGREVADITKEFPQIANDIKLPQFFNSENFFSSVLRISSKDIQVWTHYDIMDNLLIQVRGRKRVVLFDPADVNYLYLKEDKSQVLDIDNPNLNLYPDFIKAKKYICILEPGDILFIPALWFHNTKALSFGVGLNVFWKNLDCNLYDKNDYYGNKDLIPAMKALTNVENAARLLCQLPPEYKDFYLKRCIKVIEDKLQVPDPEKS